MPDDGPPFDPYALARTVSRFYVAARNLAAELDQHRIVDIAAERALDCFKIRAMAIGRKLNPMRQAGSQVGDEVGRMHRIASAD